ncbi:uncharacterized protein LOC117176230 [Belonocnema kinseyi]|uniref:uncharacterized protein LOC117176230 n=1 Tax=Belonocnema kinseyi TaxID=2817044 RepID=UPI00143CF45C|nr:uncharacterized protein LOC117176230 [Belonocnema kinseyi]XP_033222264.1 uncharacterized protein LOC117176230 [Belonocnema kinseyi]
MQVESNKRLKDVATTIRSCLITRQEEVTIPMLERDYEDMEGERIPFREFNCPSVLNFLRQLGDTVWTETKNGKTIIHPVESQKTRHVSSLVQNQRKPRARDRVRKSRRPYRGFQGGKTRVSMDSRLLMNLVNQVNKDRSGISIRAAIDYVNRFSHPVQITRKELECQLKEVSHEVLIWGDHLYPTNRVAPSSQRNSSNNSSRLTQSSPLSRNDRSRSLNHRSENRPERRSYVEPVQKLKEEKKHQVSPVKKTSEGNRKVGLRDEVMFHPAGFTAFENDNNALTVEKRVSFATNTGQGLQNGYRDQQNYRDQENSSRGNTHDYPSQRSSTQPQNSEASAQYSSNSCKNGQDSSPRNEEDSSRLRSSSPSFRNNRSRSLNYRSENRPERRSYDESVQKLNEEKKRQAPARKKSEEDSKADVRDEVMFRPAGFTAFGEDKSASTIEKRVSRPRSNGQGLQNGYRDQQRRDSSPNKKSLGHNVQSSPINQEDSSSFNSSEYNSSKYNESSHRDEERNANFDKESENKDYDDENSFEDDLEEDLSRRIKISTRIRLTRLIQQYPEGIWCAELPKTYLHEYNIPLIYAELGFATVRDFASHLPNIFHCIKPFDAGDYKLFSADRPPPDLCNEERREIENIDELKKIYRVAALPEESDPKLLLPQGAMEIKESIRPISVAELGGEEGIEEIEVLNVFSPSFFWVQLRRNFSKFKKLTEDLNIFYEKNQMKYQIPNFFLERGLNVACVHSKKWQRGIIKSVSPERRVTVQFYDNGLEKSYAPDEIFFLHRMFSYLPAQAIPCGLFNVKPFQTAKWSKNVIWEFTTKTSIPLIATIGSLDLEENSMLVSLTDTRGDDDFHISDWMYEQKFGEEGQLVCRKRNFAFWYYKESLERKGYDSSAIHQIRPIYFKSKGGAENLETEEVEYKPVEIKSVETKTVEIKATDSESAESQSEESRPASLRLKRIQASLAKYLAKQEAEKFESDKPQTEISRSEYKEPSRNFEVAPSIESESNIQILKDFLIKESSSSKDRSPPFFNRSRKLALFEKYNSSNQNDDSLKKLDTSLTTNSSSRESISIRSPLILQEIRPSGERREDSFFGSIKSECGGNGRMEPINWTEVRSALEPKNDQFFEKSKVNLKPKPILSMIPKTKVPLVSACLLNFVENDLNSALYDENVGWVPADNFSSSVSNNSPLLKLKQKIHNNSYKQSDISISPKVIGIINGKSQDSEDDEIEEPIENEVKVQKQKVVCEEKKVSKIEVEESAQKVQLPPRIMRLLEMQNKVLKSSI